MGKKKISVLAALLALLPLLGSCGNNVTGTAYTIIAGTNCIAKAVVTANNGKIVSSSYDAAYTVNYWAKLDKEALDKDDVQINTAVYENDSGDKTYYPANIKIGGYAFKGTRGDGTNDMVKEYIDYNAEDVTLSPTGSTDLYTYIITGDANKNVGKQAGWYFECMKAGKFAVLDKDGKEIDHKYLNIPGSINKSSSEYTGTDYNAWKANMDVFSAFFKDNVAYSQNNSINKAVITKSGSDYTIKVADLNVEQTVSGSTLSTIEFKAYYAVTDYAFASVEYSSYGAY
jgi:hypothetical protein